MPYFLGGCGCRWGEVCFSKKHQSNPIYFMFLLARWHIFMNILESETNKSLVEWDLFFGYPMVAFVGEEPRRRRIGKAGGCSGYDATASTAPYVLGVHDTKSGWCRMRYAINPMLERGQPKNQKKTTHPGKNELGVPTKTGAQNIYCIHPPFSQSPFWLQKP